MWNNSSVRLSRHAPVTLAILAFLVRGAFYCAEQPLWEGFDEWAHYAYIDHLARYSRLPGRTDPIPDAVRRSLDLVPLAPAAVGDSKILLSHDAWWRLPAEVRRRREQELRALPLGQAHGLPAVLPIYEAQQPPLYYLLLALPCLALRNAPLLTQAFVLRLASLLLAAAGLLAAYSLARAIPACRRAALPLLILMALWPGLAIEESRIANDTLALGVGSLFLLTLFRTPGPDAAWRDWALAGVALGVALLTKGYFLLLVPVLPIAALFRRGRLQHGALALSLALLIGGWWYVRAWLATGTVAGEILDTAAARFGLAGRLAAIPRVNWLRVLDTGAATHIWPGGWSFLNVRAWMYRVFELAALAALAGLLRLVRRRIEPRFVLTASAFLLFCLGLAYFATIVFLTRGYSMVPGWYLYGIGGIEAAVLACGFTGLAGRRSARCLAALAVLAAAFDLYTVHFVSIPYYCGIVAHGASGRLAAFHVSSLRGLGLAGLLDRMAVNKPLGAGWLAVLWAGYVLSTLALAVAGLRLVMGGARPVGTRRRATSP